MGFITSCIATATVAVLFVAMLGGIYSRAQTRVFLGGMALGGWGYIIVVNGSYTLPTIGNEILPVKAVQCLEYVWPDTSEGASWYFSLKTAIICCGITSE
jgi:hypothetical protein